MREVQNYGRHAGDEDVKIYRGKEKPPRRPAAESSPQPKASKPQKKRQARDFRDVNWKDIALPVVAIAALVLVWMLPTTGWVRAVSFLIPYLIGGFDGVMAALERLANKEFLHKEPLTVLASFAAFAVGAYGEAVLLVLLLKICSLAESAAVNRSRRDPGAAQHPTGQRKGGNGGGSSGNHAGLCEHWRHYCGGSGRADPAGRGNP